MRHKIKIPLVSLLVVLSLSACTNNLPDKGKISSENFTLDTQAYRIDEFEDMLAAVREELKSHSKKSIPQWILPHIPNEQLKIQVGLSQYHPLVIVKAIYPEQELKNKIEGYVILALTINHDSHISEIDIIRSFSESGPTVNFEKAAVTAARSFKYRPISNLSLRRPVKNVPYIFTFSFNDTCVLQRLVARVSHGSFVKTDCLKEAVVVKDYVEE